MTNRENGGGGLHSNAVSRLGDDPSIPKDIEDGDGARTPRADERPPFRQMASRRTKNR